MIELVRLATSDSGSALFELDERDDGIRSIGRHDGITRDQLPDLRAGLDDLRDALTIALNALSAGQVPEQISIRFGIKMTSQGAAFARTPAEGTFDVAVVWRSGQSDQDPARAEYQ